MIEIVVVLVIAAILAATSYTAYSAVITKAHNEVALNELEQLHHVFWPAVDADQGPPTAAAASAVSEHTMTIPSGDAPAVRPDDLTVLLRDGSGPSTAGADGLPSMANHQVSVAVDVDAKMLVTAQRSGATGWCAKVVTVDHQRVYRQAFKLAPGQQCTTGADGGGGDPSVTPTQIVATAESNHNKTIPVSWPRIDVDAVTGYSVSCAATGHPTRTAVVTGNTDALAGVVVTDVINGVTYDCEVSSIPSGVATPGTDDATPGAYCLSTGTPGPSGWGLVGHCVDDPPSDPPSDPPAGCVGDCPNPTLHESFNAFRLDTLISGFTAATGGMVMDIANDPARRRLLVVTSNTRVYAIDPSTGDYTLLHDRNPSGPDGPGSLCPSIGNTSCGAYTAITVVGDYAYLLFGSTTDGNSGLGVFPSYSDVVRLDLRDDTPVLAPLPLVCTGGGSKQGTVPPYPVYVNGSGRAYDWGAESTALTSDGQRLYVAVDGSPRQIKVVDPAATPIGPASPVSYSGDLFKTSRYDSVNYGGLGAQRACDQLPTAASLTGSSARVAGLASDGTDVWALTASGQFYRADADTLGQSVSPWATFTINGAPSAQRWIESQSPAVRESLAVFGGYLYWADGTTLLRTSTADAADTISLAGSLSRHSDGVGSGAGLTKPLGLVWLGETVFVADGSRVRVGYGADNLPADDYDTLTYTASGSPTVSTVATGVPASTMSNIDISGDGSKLYVASTTQVSEVTVSDGAVRDTGCVRPGSSLNSYGFVHVAAPDFLLIAQGTSATTAAVMGMTSCDTSSGGQSPGWVSVNNQKDFVVSADGRTVWLRPGSSGNTLTRVSRQLWNISAAGVGAGVWTPSPHSCGIQSYTTATGAGIARLCQAGAPYTNAFQYTVIPYDAASGTTYPSIASATNRNLCVEKWTAAGDTMYTAQNASIRRWPVGTPPASGCGTAVTTMPRNVQAMVAGDNELFVLTVPVSGQSTIYRISG